MAANPARPRLYLDEDVPVQIAPPLRRAGFDVLTTREAGRLQTPDLEQLAFAAAERRVIVTRNRNDFLEFAKAWGRAGREHAGILILSPAFADTDFGGMARAIAAYFQLHPEGVLANLTDFISPLRQG